VPESPPTKKKLESWEQIAGHLGVNKRTAQIWDKNNSLPVHRSPTGRVFAYEEELDEWQANREIPPSIEPTARAAASEPASLPAPQLPATRPWPLRARRSAVFLAAVAATAILSAGIRFGLAGHRTPGAFRLEGNNLIIEDTNGKEIWRRFFPDGFWSDYYSPDPRWARVWFGDLDGNGRTDVLFAYHQAVAPLSNSSILFAFSERGDEKWQWHPGRDLPELRPNPSIWRIRGLAVIRGSSRRRIVVSSTHEPYYPNQVALLDADGKTLSEYWHSGQMEPLAVMDPGGGRREEILVGGVSNGYHQATLVALDPDNLQGASKEEARPEIQLHGFGEAHEVKRLLFPRSCINLAEEAYNHVVGITATRTGIQVEVRECYERLGCDVWYAFDGSLRLVSAETSDEFKTLHRLLFLHGQLDHPLNDSEEHAFQQIRCLAGCD
jgi:hypothetical protein